MKAQSAEAGADVRDPPTYEIIGAAMEVHRQLGPGFLEAVYQEALAIELTERAVLFQREVELPVYYKGRRLSCSFRTDYVCYESVIVELKAIRDVTGIEEAPVLNYLKATNIERALLLNFGRTRLEYRRFAYSNSRKTADDAAADEDHLRHL
jgi:GxxExxY protein